MPFSKAKLLAIPDLNCRGLAKANQSPPVSFLYKFVLHQQQMIILEYTTGGKYQMQYEPATGKVSLLITRIGPGDEGEYTCTAVNKFGEAICTVYIQPEGINFPQHLPVHERSSRTELLSYQTNGQELYDADFKVDTFEYRLLREVEFRESLTRRSQSDETETETETDFEQLTTPLAPPQLVQQPRNTKLQQGSDATFTVCLLILIYYQSKFYTIWWT